MDPQEEQLKAGKTPGKNWGEEPENNWGTLKTGQEETRVPTKNGNYPAFYAQVAQAINKGTPPPVSPWDAATGLEIIEAATKSAHTKQVVALPLD
jgi:predicted dehydrogenase